MSEMHVYSTTDNHDRATKLGLNLLAIVIVLALGVVLAWMLVSGSTQGILGTQMHNSIHLAPGVEHSDPPAQQPQHVPQHPIHALDEQRALRLSAAGFEVI